MKHDVILFTLHRPSLDFPLDLQIMTCHGHFSFVHMNFALNFPLSSRSLMTYRKSRQMRRFRQHRDNLMTSCKNKAPCGAALLVRYTQSRQLLVLFQPSISVNQSQLLFSIVLLPIKRLDSVSAMAECQTEGHHFHALVIRNVVVHVFVRKLRQINDCLPLIVLGVD